MEDPDASQDAYPLTPFVDFAEREDTGGFISSVRAQRDAKQERDACVADVVHFWDGEKCFAAIVTLVEDFEDEVWLSVLTPGELTVKPVRAVPHSEERVGAAITWHWGHE